MIGTIQWILCLDVHPNQKRDIGKNTEPTMIGARNASWRFLKAGIVVAFLKMSRKDMFPVTVPMPMPMNASPRDPSEKPYIGVKTRGYARKNMNKRPKIKAA